VDDTTVTGILMNCPHLKSLSLGGESITDGFQHIGNCENLEHLAIIFCPSLTDKSMEYVGAGCPRLKHLDIRECFGLTNKSIEYVCKGCQKLKFLTIRLCPEITDAILDNILNLNAENWRSLFFHSVINRRELIFF
jgi:Leucine-rich repeat (LRR) protein